MALYGRVLKHAGAKAIGVWSGHKVYTTIFTGVIALLVADPFKAWHGWREALSTLGFSCLVFLALLGIGFLAFIVWAPADLDQQAKKQISLLKLQNDDLTLPPYGMLTRRKVIENLNACSLDGLRMIQYLHASGGHVLERDLKNRFGVAGFNSANKSMLLDKQPTVLTSNSATAEPIQTNVYSIRDEYKTTLGDILSERQDV